MIADTMGQQCLVQDLVPDFRSTGGQLGPQEARTQCATVGLHVLNDEYFIATNFRGLSQKGETT